MSTDGTTTEEQQPSVEDQQKELYQRMIDDMKKSETEFQDNFHTFAEQAAAVRAELLRSFKPNSQPPIDPAIQDIVTALQQNPRLIAPTKQFILKALQAINSAVDGVLGQL